MLKSGLQMGACNGDFFLLYGWIWTLLPSAVSSSTSVLSSLADLDFHRLRANQFHSLEVPAISLQRELTGAGYHRELVTKVTLEESSEFRNSRILLVENITRDVYIDLDQVSAHHSQAPYPEFDHVDLFCHLDNVHGRY